MYEKLSAKEMHLKFLASFSYLKEWSVGKRLLVTESTITEGNGKKYRNMSVRGSRHLRLCSNHFLFKIKHL